MSGEFSKQINYSPPTDSGGREYELSPDLDPVIALLPEITDLLTSVRKGFLFKQQGEYENWHLTPLDNGGLQIKSWMGGKEYVWKIGKSPSGVIQISESFPVQTGTQSVTKWDISPQDLATGHSSERTYLEATSEQIESMMPAQHFDKKTISLATGAATVNKLRSVTSVLLSHFEVWMHDTRVNQESLFKGVITKEKQQQLKELLQRIIHARLHKNDLKEGWTSITAAPVTDKNKIDPHKPLRVKLEGLYNDLENHIFYDVIRNVELGSEWLPPRWREQDFFAESNTPIIWPEAIRQASNVWYQHQLTQYGEQGFITKIQDALRPLLSNLVPSTSSGQVRSVSLTPEGDITYKAQYIAEQPPQEDDPDHELLLLLKIAVSPIARRV